MPRNTMTVILAILILMLLFWNFKNAPDTTPEKVTAAQDEKEAALPVVAAKITPSVQVESDNIQKQQELADLQLKLNEERAQQAQRTQALSSLQTQQQQLGNTVGYRAQLSVRDSQIESLLEVLSRYRDAEEDLNRTASAALQNQDSAARATKEQLDLQIEQLEKNIQLTQADINYLQSFVGGFDVNQMQTQTSTLQARLEDLQNQLNTLRAQRVELSATVFNNSRNIQSLAEQARNELRESAAATQDQIFSMRGEVERLQRARYQSLNAQSTLRSQISRLQKDVQNNDQEIKSLEQQIRNKQAELAE